MIQLFRGAPAIIRLIASRKLAGSLPDIYAVGLKSGCKIYGKYLTRLPLAPLARMYGNFVCGIVQQPLPIIEPSKFEGGQCPVLYFIYIDHVFRGQSSIGKYGLHYGKIKSIDWRKNADGTIDKEYIDIYGGTQFNPDANALVRSVSPGGGFLWDSFSVHAIERGDGQPDDCHLQTVPVVINDEDFNKKVVVNNYNFDGSITETRELDLTIPIINIKPDFDFDFNLGGIDFNINMGGLSVRNKLDVDLENIKNKLNIDLNDIKNTLELDIENNLNDIKNKLEFEIELNLNDIKNTLEFEVDADLTDIKNKLELEVDVDLNDIKNKLDVDIENKLINIKNKLDLEVDVDLENIKNKLDVEFEEIGDKIDGLDGICKFEENPFSEEDYGPEDIEESEEEVEEEEKKKADIQWVLLEITKFPPGGKTMLMEKPEDNTYFAGYFSWLISTGSGQYRLEEIPIRKQKMAFKNPGDTQGYRFYTVNKARIKSTIYYRPQTQTAE